MQKSTIKKILSIALFLVLIALLSVEGIAVAVTLQLVASGVLRRR